MFKKTNTRNASKKVFLAYYKRDLKTSKAFVAKYISRIESHSKVEDILGRDQIEVPIKQRIIPPSNSQHSFWITDKNNKL